MKPSRKVQAQRKFAQGVQGPSGAANSGSTINEGLIKQPEHNQINVVSVSAHVLLDIISLNNIHSHREPVVLIERLRDSTIKKVQKRTKERVIFKKKRTNNRKSTYTYAWDMKLRSRIVIKDDSEEAMSNKKRTTTRRRRNTSKFSPNVKRRRNSNSLNFTSDDNRPLTYFTTTPENKCTSKDKSILNGGVPKRNINEVLRETKKRMRSKVKRHNNVVMKRKQRTKRTTATAAKAFTVSVSRVRKNLRSHRQRLGCERVPESPDEMVSMSEDTIVDIPADVVLTHQPRDMFDQLPDASINILSNTCLLEADDATVLTVCDTAADMFSDVVMQLPNDAADDNLNKEYHVNVDTQKSPIKEEIQSVKSGCHPTVETAQNSGCRQRNSIEFDDISAYDSQVPYYNEHGIQRWITENLPFPLPNITKVSSENHPSTSSAEHVGVCPANSWRTLKEVVQAPTHLLEARCTNCNICVKINKLFTLSKIFEKQRDMECTYQGQDNGGSPEDNHNDTATMTVIRSDDDGDNVYMELLPRDPHLIVKVKVREVLKKNILSARLVPRSHVQIENEFNLEEHEYLIDQLIETLTVSLENSSGATFDNQATPSLIDLTDGDENTLRTKTDIDALNENITRDCFTDSVENPKLVEAPVFYPSTEEFTDPIKYFEEIYPLASKYGICKIVPPPPEFSPNCNIDDDVRFDVTNQYIARLYSRWGPAARELCAIKACLKKSGNFTRTPLFDGVEVNLPKLHKVVQRHGGLEKVINSNRWNRVAAEMHFEHMPNVEKKLDNIYVKYLLPFDTLSLKEQQDIIRKVERSWMKRSQKILNRACNPLHRQKCLLGESDSSGEETDDDSEVDYSVLEAEDCIVPGSFTNLGKFKKVATNVAEYNLKRYKSETPVTPRMIEEEYWRVVMFGTDHLCVNTASIDTGAMGYGFPKNSNVPYGDHPWNMKVLSKNKNNILSFLGPVLGVTVPTLHLGMMYSTSCWHRDPHALPWLEYMHRGPAKMWYGIPDEQSRNFRKAVEVLCPMACQNKPIWLPSDITMIPPNLLLQHNVSLSKLTQNPGEFVMVFPKAYSCSICTGFTISESVYFASHAWLNTADQVFQELRESCEPAMLSLDHLLLTIATDPGPRPQLSVLQRVHATLTNIVRDEERYREALKAWNLDFVHDQNRRDFADDEFSTGIWNPRELDECDVCRMPLYLSKVVDVADKQSPMCLQHALRYLDFYTEVDAESSWSLHVVISLTMDELKTAIVQLQNRLVEVPDVAN